MPTQDLSLLREALDNAGRRDRRAVPRHPLAGTSARATVTYAGRDWEARVWNISCDGLCLQVPEPVSVGSLVAVALSSTSGRFARTLEVRVLHAHTTVDGCHIFGGSFGSDRLDPDDVAALLAPRRPH